MCGIFCCIPKNFKSTESKKCPYCSEKKLHSILENRGPDSQGEAFLANHGLTFAGFVLWQQGEHLYPQPVQLAEDQFILLFNGDIFNVHELRKAEDVKAEMKEQTELRRNSNDLRQQDTARMSDTEWLAMQLEKALSAPRSEDDLDVPDELLQLLRSIEGPYSCIFYSNRWQSIFFLRDAMGRNSLLFEYAMDLQHFHLLSTTTVMTATDNKIVVEVPPFGLYRIPLNDVENWTLIPWQQPNATIRSQIEDMSKCLAVKIHCQMNRIINPLWLTTIAISEVQSFNFYELCESYINKTPGELYEYLLRNSTVKTIIQQLSTLLERSVRDRVQFTQKSCKDCIQRSRDCKHSKVAILFSGGLDCSILAILCDKYIYPEHSIDLINVAFESSKSVRRCLWEDVPDRLTSRATLESLKELCPNRVWNYMEINVTRRELKEQLATHLKHLIYPLKTVLDESIGSAFWFAARALVHEEVAKPDQSSAQTACLKVILLGTGADELFGGYIRHRNAFTRCPGDSTLKLERVRKELDFDWERLPYRNLARDDRCISDTGRTPRAPYLEENFTQFIRSLPSEQRCCFTLPLGIGDKLLLRVYAYSLGLRSASILPKRAIQFGSRIADSKQNAKDRSFYLN